MKAKGVTLGELWCDVIWKFRNLMSFYRYLHKCAFGNAILLSSTIACLASQSLACQKVNSAKYHIAFASYFWHVILTMLSYIQEVEMEYPPILKFRNLPCGLPPFTSGQGFDWTHSAAERLIFAYLHRRRLCYSMMLNWPYVKFDCHGGIQYLSAVCLARHDMALAHAEQVWSAEFGREDLGKTNSLSVARDT